ncbi:MAG: hypothetical protein L3K23_04495 [Thermoplasmata archaeon]|nr:hypothetical protein [Thermoplasmata archaeon]
MKSWAVRSLILGALLLLLVPPIGGTESRVALPPPHPQAAAAASGSSSAAAAGPIGAEGQLANLRSTPAITGAYDWDPQPLNLFPPFPVDEVGGLGAAMASSDPLGTVVMFGGEGSHGLTNLTITDNQTTALWNLRPATRAPSPRANLSFATLPDGKFAVAFGGVVNLTTGQSDNGTFLYDFRNRTWINETGPVAPPPREGAAFAIDASRNVAILQGGRDPDYLVKGSGAYVFWNDTWALNLTTFRWTQQAPVTAPPPMFGSSMVWVPQTANFLLFGGCATFCSNELYQYIPGGNWTLAPQSGDVPSPRAGASEVWSPNWNITMMNGGFIWGNDTYAPLGDTFIFTPSTHSWDTVASAGGPSPRFGSPAAFLNANNCPGMFVVGGSTAYSPPPADGWFLDENPDVQLGCNNWGGDEVGGSTGGGGVGNCPVGANTSTLSVQVLDRATHLGLVGAVVNITGYCSLQLTTLAGGFANFTDLPNETVRVTTSFPAYHLNVTYALLPVPTGRLVVEMDRYPSLTVHTVGTYAIQGEVALPGVPVFYDSVLGPDLLGSSDANGYLRIAVLLATEGPTHFFANVAGYANASVPAFVPFTGPVNVTLDLLSYGGFDVHVLRDPGGPSIPRAVGTITPVGFGAYGSPFDFATDAQGWFNVSLPLSNYSVNASARGYLPNGTGVAIFHGWVNDTVVVLPLPLLYGANVSVRLIDARSHLPIAGGTVTIDRRPPASTGPLGWANFSDLLPPGRAVVLGAAPGYFNNSTAVDLEYRAILAGVRLDLIPVSGCPSNCPPPANLTGSSPFRLLPSGGITLELFLLAPLLLALAGAAYAWTLRRTPLPRSG